tara:strand:+ start:44 stop:688 length:645 start_codon:yes stop_codon:yes gene_type:complete
MALETHNRWTVTGFVMKPRSDGRKMKYAKCLCECGTEKDVAYKDVKAGRSKSCGCLQKEKAKSNKPNATHGMYGTKVYRIWRGMKTRCNNPNVVEYPDYGGRGIKVCSEWETFEGFYSSMGDVPNGDFTLERNDNDKGYSIHNCRWVDRKTQANNRRNNTCYEIGGTTKTVAEWCEQHNQPVNRVYSRLKYGWDIMDALLLPKITTGNAHESTA